MSITTTRMGERTVLAPSEYVVSVRGLRKHFPVKEGVLQRVTGHVRAVDDVSFDIRRGETVGLVGESGCGKTTLGRCISGLLNPTEGGVYFGLETEAHRELDELLRLPSEEKTAGQTQRLKELAHLYEIDAMPKKRWAEYRRNCQVVFQDAFSSLNPRQLVKDIVGRPLRVYREASGSELNARVVELLDSVGLGEQHLYRYPHQFSGGQRQRISIARALALDPSFIVLDEPTSALDVSVQAQILNLLHRLQKERGLTYLFITHDLSVVRHMSDRIVVMYLGQICETGPSRELFEHPRHPYTKALIAADPSESSQERAGFRLMGPIPDPARPPQGCRFHTRCPVATEFCGWDVDDVVRQLESSGVSIEGITAVQRHSEFSADLDFDTEEQAVELVGQLQSEAVSEPMKRSLSRLMRSEKRVSVGFDPVEEVRLEQVGPEHDTACVWHTHQYPQLRERAPEEPSS
ncbi:MAG: ABC transporter ATP-binding protein [Actinomycetota bacterium]